MKARRLLWPLSMLYRVGNEIDRRRKRARSFRSRLPVISVGNLSVGGAGKTPVVIHLLTMLGPLAPVIVLSRGYGRTIDGDSIWTAGDPEPDPDSLGDEPALIGRYIKNGCVAVGADRASILESLEHRWPTAVVLLDDGFQHYRLERDLDVVIVDSRTVKHPRLLPVGDLREPVTELRRADVILATSPEASLLAERYASSHTPILRVDFVPRSVDRWIDRSPLDGGLPVTLVTGIARPRRVVETLERLGYSVKRHLTFSDHHRYLEREVAAIIESSAGMPLVTTSKDAVKLARFPTLREVLYVVDIEVEIADDERFKSIVMAAARLNTRN